MRPLTLSVILSVLCATPGIAKAEAILCPIETATVTPGEDRIVCGNEADLKRCGENRDKFKVQRDMAIQTADQNLGLWMMCRIKLDAERSKTSADQALNHAMTMLALTPVIPTPDESSIAPYLVGGAIGLIVGVGGTIAAILLIH